MQLGSSSELTYGLAKPQMASILASFDQIFSLGKNGEPLSSMGQPVQKPRNRRLSPF
jgi:hypothetical protein